MEKEKKEFESFPIHSIRMSDKTWQKLKDKRNRSGLTWNKFIGRLLDNKKEK
jgi:hypothetical protein